jgi:hypothetical protein
VVLLYRKKHQAGRGTRLASGEQPEVAATAVDGDPVPSIAGQALPARDHCHAVWVQIVEPGRVGATERARTTDDDLHDPMTTFQGLTRQPVATPFVT